MAKRLENYFVVVAGIDPKHTYFAAVADDHPDHVRYFKAPVVKGVERFDGQLDAVLGSLVQGAALPAGAVEVDEPSSPYVKRALRNSHDPLVVLGPVRQKGEFVSLVAVGLGSDGKRQQCAAIEHHTGMSIKFIDGLKDARRFARSANRYIEERPELQQLFRGSKFGKSPRRFPSKGVKKAFLGLRNPEIATKEEEASRG